MSHSIPEPSAVAIRTPLGAALHTGDWKLDDEPAHQRADRRGPAQGARRGRDFGAGLQLDQCRRATACSPSEADVAVTLAAADPRGAAARRRDHLRLECRAHPLGGECRARGGPRTRGGRPRHVPRHRGRRRRPAISTRPLAFLEETLSPSCRPTRSWRCAPAARARPRAAMARIAQDEHPNVKLDAGDRVIFSSRTIPGNEKAVGRVQNALADLGSRGHHRPGRAGPCVRPSASRRTRAALSLGSSPTSPFRCMARGATSKPMPSSPRRSACARWCGLATAPWCGFLPGSAEIIDEVPVGRLTATGDLTRADDGQVRERRKLSFAGAVAVSLVLSDKGALLADPEVAADRIASHRQGRNAFTEIARDAVIGTIESLPKPRRKDTGLGQAKRSAAASAPPSTRRGARSPCAPVLLLRFYLVSRLYRQIHAGQTSRDS